MASKSKPSVSSSDPKKRTRKTNTNDSNIKKEIINDNKTPLNQEINIDSSNELFANQINSRIISNYETDYRDIIIRYDVSKNISRPRMTQYEKALVLGKRATQISGGSKPNITVKVGMTVQEIATEELRQKKVPFIIKRPIGSGFEYWKIADLFVNLD